MNAKLRGNVNVESLQKLYDFARTQGIILDVKNANKGCLRISAVFRREDGTVLTGEV